MSELKVCENCKQEASVYAMDTISDGWGGYYCDSHIPTGFYRTDRLIGGNND